MTVILDHGNLGETEVGHFDLTGLFHSIVNIVHHRPGMSILAISHSPVFGAHRNLLQFMVSHRSIRIVRSSRRSALPF